MIASIDADQVAKPKSFIHWISADEATECETRIYGPLFLVNNPNEYENFVEKLNPESVVTHKRSLMNSRLLGDLKILDRWFVADSDCSSRGRGSSRWTTTRI